MKRLIGLGLLVLAACNVNAIGECIGTAIGSAIGRSLGVGSYESARNADRPDEIRGDAGSALYVSGVVSQGRLVVTFDTPPIDESLPSTRGGDGGCESVGDFAYLYDADAGRTMALAGNVALSPADGGTLLRCTQLVIRLGDGGTGAAVDDRDFLVP